MAAKTTKAKDTPKEKIPTPEAVETPPELKDPPPEEIDPKIKANVDAANAGKDFVSLAHECLSVAQKECNDEKQNPRFWEVIRDEAIKQIGPPSQEMKPMSEGRKADFLKEEMPYGQFEGKRVSFVLKKDRNYLEKFAKQPHPFQKDLLRFLASESAETEKKK